MNFGHFFNSFSIDILPGLGNNGTRMCSGVRKVFRIRKTGGESFSSWQFFYRETEDLQMKKKVVENKIQKKNALFRSSFDLFLNHGFSKTTIADIVKKAGLAKGTFYLYFKDKYDLRDKLVAHITGQLFEEAHQHLHSSTGHPDFETSVIKICDFFIERFENDPKLLAFISKNLSWGIFRHALNMDVPDEDFPFYRHFIDQMEAYHICCPQPELMLFTIIELISSACHSCILYRQPVSMEEYKPYLHSCILAILHVYTETEK